MTCLDWLHCYDPVLNPRESNGNILLLFFFLFTRQENFHIVVLTGAIVSISEVGSSVLVEHCTQTFLASLP